MQPTFKAELKAQEDIHEDIGFIRQALRDGLRRYAYRCVLELESVLIADGIADKEFLEDVFRLRDEFKNECDERKAKFEIEQDESECADMVNAPDLTPNLLTQNINSLNQLSQFFGTLTNSWILSIYW